MLSLDLSGCVGTIKQYVMISGPKHQIPQVIYWMEKHQLTGIGCVCICHPPAASKPEDAAPRK